MTTIETAADLAAIIETTGDNQRYATTSDVCDMIAAALGDYADEHDIEAIADEGLRLVPRLRPRGQRRVLARAGLLPGREHRRVMGHLRQPRALIERRRPRPHKGSGPSPKGDASWSRTSTAS